MSGRPVSRTEGSTQASKAVTLRTSDVRSSACPRGLRQMRTLRPTGHVGRSGRITGVDDNSCVFCGLLEGRSPAQWVAREDAAVAFLPLPGSALALGHTLVAPTAHVLGVQDASARDLAVTMALVGRISRAMHSALGATGVNVLNASGLGSEQSVPHLHFHVVPRWEGDGFTTWPAERSNKSLDVSPRDALASALPTH
jgi:histidine triad (HIT) family protein